MSDKKEEEGGGGGGEGQQQQQQPQQSKATEAADDSKEGEGGGGGGLFGSGGKVNFGSLNTAGGGGVFGSSLSNPSQPLGNSSGLFSPATFGSKGDKRSGNEGTEKKKKEEGGAEGEAEAETEGQEGDDGTPDADESAAADFQPLVQMPEVQVQTMEEDEEVVFKMRAKLYTFVKEDVYGGEVRKNWWKERGLGDVKLLKHKESGLTRLLMRQEKTLKICANHLVSPTVEINSNVGSDKSWVFTASDFADGEVKTETFAIKFGSPENATKFKEAMETAKKSNKEASGAQKQDSGDKNVEKLESAVSSLNIDEKEKEKEKEKEQQKEDHDEDGDL